MTRIEEERIDEMLADAISERDRPIIGDGSLYDFHPSELVNALQELKELRAQGGVRVKGLEWEHVTDQIPKHAYAAYTPFSRCLIVVEFLSMNHAVYRFNGTDYETLEEAKAAAFADYRTRILSALETEAVEPVGYISTKKVWDYFYGEKRGSPTPEDFADFLVSNAHPPHSSIPTVTGEIDEGQMRDLVRRFVEDFDQRMAIGKATDIAEVELVTAARAALSSESKP